ncbi:hypothetical protein THAOC_29096, partial [Thalassiosira oceanica]
AVPERQVLDIHPRRGGAERGGTRGLGRERPDEDQADHVHGVEVLASRALRHVRADTGEAQDTLGEQRRPCLERNPCRVRKRRGRGLGGGDAGLRLGRRARGRGRHDRRDQQGRRAREVMKFFMVESMLLIVEV